MIVLPAAWLDPAVPRPKAPLAPFPLTASTLRPATEAQLVAAVARSN
jgi:hypothetical protein